MTSTRRAIHASLTLPLAMSLGMSVGLALGLAGCRSGAKPASQAEAPPPLAPWSWHSLGGVLIIQGEVSEPTDIFLQGRSVRGSMHAELGPVYWEMLQPPKGEQALLMDGKGRVLARWNFLGNSSEAYAKQEAQRAAKAAPKLTRKVAPSRPDAPRSAQAAVSPAPRAPGPVTPKPAAPAPAPAPPKAIASKLISSKPIASKPTTLKAAPLPEVPKARVLARMSPPEPAPVARHNPPAPALPAAPEPSASAASAMGLWPGAGEGLNLTQGPRSQKVILLSFDGGSSAEAAPAILDALKARGIRTSFFLTGAFVRRFPDITRRILADGHEIGNHTLDHPHFAPGMRRDPAWTKARVQKELLDADGAFYALTGRTMDPLWRAPYGEHTPEIRRWAEELGYRHVGWSEGADSLDWATAKERHLYRSGAAILERLHQRLDRNGEGLVVLMHVGSERPEGDRPAERLGVFLDRALAEGWRFVSAGEMLRLMGKPAWNRQARGALLRAEATPAGTQ